MESVTYTKKLPRPYLIQIRDGRTAWRAQKILTITDANGKPRKHKINATRKTAGEAVYPVLERLLRFDDPANNFRNSGVGNLLPRTVRPV